MCIFVDMKQTLPEYIAQHEELRQLLLAQEGGIMKYLAEHLDASDSATLFRDYQNLCVEKFHEANKWVYYKVWEGDDMRRAALGEVEHLWKEVNNYSALKPQLITMEDEVAEKIDWFVDLYLTYAYRLDRKRRFPKGQTDSEVYQEVIEMYNSLGLAYKCMEIILKEHHTQGDVEKTDSELFTEFLIRQYSNQLTLGVLSQMRRAVAEMLIGKTPEQCRQMAIDTMKRVRGFSQMIYTDDVVESLRPKSKTMAEQREKDGKWLSDVANRTVLEEFSAKVKSHSMRYYFADFVNLLKDVGRIWAAQLLVRGIDMKVLEKGVCCILKPSDEPFYYVDKFYFDDLPGRYCISNEEIADKLLYDIYGVELREEDVSQNESDDEKNVEEEKHSQEYYGEDQMIFHENLNVKAIVNAVRSLPRGEVKSNRKYFLTVYTAFDKLHWLTCKTMTKFISWMKFHSGIHFETNDFKNLEFDEDMEILLPEIIAVFSEEIDDDCYDDKEVFYRKNPQGDYLIKINKGYD